MPIQQIITLHCVGGKNGTRKAEDILITCKLIKLENSCFDKYTCKTIICFYFPSQRQNSLNILVDCDDFPVCQALSRGNVS